MNIREDQLEASLKRGVSPAYWIMSDDAFLRDESEGKLLELLLKKNSEQGSEPFECVEKRYVGVDFSPQQFFQDTSHFSLFSTRKILAIRSDKPLDATLADIFLTYLKNPAPDICLIINSGRPSGVTQWQQKLTEAIPTLTLWPPSYQDFPGYIQNRARLFQIKLTPPQLQQMAQAFEGNLAGLQQVLTQLPLYQKDSQLTDEALALMLNPHAYYSVFDLSPAIFEGDLTRACRILHFFEKNEPQELVGIISILAREFRTLGTCLQAAKIENLATVFKTHRIWPKLQSPYSHALRGLSQRKILHMILRLSQLDLMAKGFEPGDPWSALHQEILQLWKI